MLQPPPASVPLWPTHANAGLWGLGNGLTSTTLATYMARELGAEGLAVGLIVASPNLAGTLRFAAPALLRTIGSRKTFSIATFLASGLLLLLLPLLAWPGLLPSKQLSLAVLVMLWGLWHLAMFLGVISLWSWIGDLVPGEIRGRFIGIRQSWLMTGQVVGMLAAGLFSFTLAKTLPDLPKWQPWAWPAMFGAICMLLAVLPLVALPNLPLDRARIGTFRDSLLAMTDRRFVPHSGAGRGLRMACRRPLRACFPSHSDYPCSSCSPCNQACSWDKQACLPQSVAGPICLAAGG
jgi:MFS family permease